MNRTMAIALCGVLLTGNIRCQGQGGDNLATPAKDSSDLSVKLTAIEKAVEAMCQAENVPGVALVIVKNETQIKAGKS